MNLMLQNYLLTDLFLLISYPITVTKIAMAKGIVTDFPVLADIGECTWVCSISFSTTFIVDAIRFEVV